MGVIVSQITGVSIVYATVYTNQVKGNIKTLRHWPLWREFTVDHWILHTKGQ